ncbi:hypothetical protein [Rathayibacter tritici]|uniref:hypothetical protein n=1 Tax=Rathayibacter tritici TaxID=33888 RepID=UPI0012FACC05|nr:hypothetical protein [Rathayibacter tritici]
MIVAAFTVVLDAIQAMTIVTGRAPFAFGRADGAVPLSYLPQLLQADLRDGATGTLADSTFSVRLICALPTALHAATVVLGALFLLRALRGISLARPFDTFVLGNWQRLSVALLAGGSAQGLADTAATIYLNTRIGLLFGTGHVSEQQRIAFLGSDYRTIGTNLPQWPIPIIIAGLIAAALTAAFRAGALLEEDVDGVV